MNTLTLNNIDHLTNWQKDIISSLSKESDLKQIIIFEKYGYYNIWIITIFEPTISVMYKYSKIYFDVMDTYLDVDCDFLVFSEGFIKGYKFPDNTIVVSCI